MKKIKIMLSVIAVLSAVGGALAFKAKSDDIFCSTTSGGQCQLSHDYTFATGANFIQSLYCTDQSSGVCDKTVTTE